MRIMAIERVNIQPDILRWVSEEKAIEAFPLLDSWLPQKKQPTLNQLKRFAVKFYVPLVYLFMDNRPEEVIPFPMFRGEAGQQDHFDLNVYDTVMTFRQDKNGWRSIYWRMKSRRAPLLAL